MSQFIQDLARQALLTKEGFYYPPWSRPWGMWGGMWPGMWLGCILRDDADGRREPRHLWQHGVASRAITKSGVRTIPTRFPKCTWSASSGPARTKATWSSTLFWAAARLARWRVLCADAPSASNVATAMPSLPGNGYAPVQFVSPKNYSTILKFRHDFCSRPISVLTFFVDFFV